MAKRAWLKDLEPAQRNQPIHPHDIQTSPPPLKRKSVLLLTQRKRVRLGRARAIMRRRRRPARARVARRVPRVAERDGLVGVAVEAGAPVRAVM